MPAAPAGGAAPAATPTAPARTYDDLVPGSLAWIAATHGGSGDDGERELETAGEGSSRGDAAEARRAAKQAKAEKRLAARRAREEKRAAARAEKERVKQERAEAKRRDAEQRAEARRREDEKAESEKAERARTRLLAEEQAAAERAELEQRRQVETEAAEQKARRREQSKAAAVAALAGRRASSRPDDARIEHTDSPTVGTDEPEASPSAETASQGSLPDAGEDTALLEAVGTTAGDDAEDTGRADEADPVSSAEVSEPGEGTTVVAGIPVDERTETAEGDTKDARADGRRAAAAATVARRREKAEAKARSRADSAAIEEPLPVDAARSERRRASRGTAADDVPEPPSVPTESSFGPTRIAGLVGVVIGVVGLVASVLLALAALLVAFGFEADSGLLQAVSAVADPLTAPLRGLVSFSGENAAAKEAFVAYGGGSVFYLILGVAAPSLLSRRDG